MSSRIPLRYQHWCYVWIPIFTALMWFATLLTMLLSWVTAGRQRYPTQEGNIAYISDIGASVLKPLFVTGCAITACGFFLSLLAERLLRRTGRLMPNLRQRERVLSILAIVCAFIGGLGLLFLSIFDTNRFPKEHRSFLFLFISGVGLSAVFSVIEYRWVSNEFEDLKSLQRAYIAKGVIGGTLILLAIAFGVARFHASDIGGIFEWLIAFGFTFYVLTFWYDLRMAKNVEKGELKARFGAHASNPEHGIDMRQMH